MANSFVAKTKYTPQSVYLIKAKKSSLEFRNIILVFLVLLAKGCFLDECENSQLVFVLVSSQPIEPKIFLKNLNY